MSEQYVQVHEISLKAWSGIMKSVEVCPLRSVDGGRHSVWLCVKVQVPGAAREADPRPLRLARKQT